MIVNTSVSTSVDVALPAEKVKLSVSPSLSAYIMIWNIDLPTYEPKGGVESVSCTPRTAVPTSAVSVPDDWSTPLSVTIAVKAMLLANSPTLNSVVLVESSGGKGAEGGGVSVWLCTTRRRAANMAAPTKPPIFRTFDDKNSSVGICDDGFDWQS